MAGPVEGGKRLNGISVDVEDWFNTTLAGISPETRGREHSGLQYAVPYLLELFSELGVRATFFWLGEMAQRFPLLVREVDAAGHELASHGWEHKLLPDMSHGELARELDHSRKLLQDLSGQDIAGHRSACWSLGARDERRLRAIAANHLYEAGVLPLSWFPFLKGGDAQRGPYRDKGSGLVVFPATSWGPGKGWFPCGGGAFMRGLPLWVLMRCLRGEARARRPFQLYLHPYEVFLDPLAGLPWGKRFLLTCGGGRGLVRKVRRIAGEFVLVPLREVLSAEGLLR